MMPLSRAQKQHILKVVDNGDAFTPSRSAAVPASNRVAKTPPPVGRAAVNVTARVPIASSSGLYDSNGKLRRNGKQDCRHNNCRGMTDLVDDNHSVPHANIG